MRKNKINSITIYSRSNLVQNLLTQIYEEYYSINTVPYSSLNFTALNTQSISIIDVKNQMVFNKIVKSCLEFPVVYPIIILIPNTMTLAQRFESSGISVLSKPLRYQTLLNIISSYESSFVYRLTHNLFLNTKTFNIIKILDQKRIEINLTQLEYKILKYLVENGIDRVVTEREILINVFKYDVLSDTHTLKTHMHRLKQKLGVDSCIIERKDNQYTYCA